MREKKSGVAAVGVSSLLVIFAVLCLTVFALLTVSTVRANQSLSDSAASALLGYYQADTNAEKTLAALRSGDVPAGVTQVGDVFYYAHPISDTQTLAVAVRVEGSGYHILRWQAVSTAEWQADDRLPVWDGETEDNV